MLYNPLQGRLERMCRHACISSVRILLYLCTQLDIALEEVTLDKQLRTLAISSVRSFISHTPISSVLIPKCAQLDILARAPLWKGGYDYGHGTGHGVGAYLNVHEVLSLLSLLVHKYKY